MRSGQVGAKWLAGIHSWAARPRWEVKVDAISGWSEKCRVRSGGRVLRLSNFWPVRVREESLLKRWAGRVLGGGIASYPGLSSVWPMLICSGVGNSYF